MISELWPPRRSSLSHLLARLELCGCSHVYRSSSHLPIDFGGLAVAKGESKWPLHLSPQRCLGSQDKCIVVCCGLICTSSVCYSAHTVTDYAGTALGFDSCSFALP